MSILNITITEMDDEPPVFVDKVSCQECDKTCRRSSYQTQILTSFEVRNMIIEFIYILINGNDNKIHKFYYPFVGIQRHGTDTTTCITISVYCNFIYFRADKFT